MPGVEGRIDHFASDLAGERLFVCALGNNSLEVVDLRKGERIHSITGLGCAARSCLYSGVNRLFVANDKGGICKIYDGKSFQQLANWTLKMMPTMFVTMTLRERFMSGLAAAESLSSTRRMENKSGQSNFRRIPKRSSWRRTASRIFVNVPNSRHVAVIDRDKGEVIATWKTDLAFANFPMALDETNHRLFVGCRLPSKLVVLNTDSGDVVAKIDISGDADEIFYDGKRHRIYAICGAGKIDIIEQTDPNNYRALS